MNRGFGSQPIKENKKEIIGVSEEVMEVFANYGWPGNIRELENLIERAVVLTKTKLITRNNMPPFLYDNEENQELTSIPSDNAGTLKEQTQRFQKNWILEALRKSNGVQKKAAQLLGVKPTTLNEMIKRMGIDINEIDG